MSKAKVSEQQFIDAWKRLGSPELVAKETGMDVRNVYRRRNSIEGKHGIILKSRTRDQTNRSAVVLPRKGPRRLLNISGSFPVYSDAHIWPGDRSVASAALMAMIDEFKPKVIIDNGDSFDGARISRHPPAGWEHTPDVADELDAVKEHKAEIEARAPKGCKLLWNFGNHDSRFSMRLAAQAPEFINVRGVDLKDHFPSWNVGWSTLVNDTVMVKHRYANGIHATYNNTLKSGLTMVTGHLHKQCATPWADYNGLRWGVDTGTLSDIGPEEQKFLYTEDNPTPWISGFAWLTFDKNGMLLMPEFVTVIQGKAYFRGQAV